METPIKKQILKDLPERSELCDIFFQQASQLSYLYNYPGHIGEFDVAIHLGKLATALMQQSIPTWMTLHHEMGRMIGQKATILEDPKMLDEEIAISKNSLQLMSLHCLEWSKELSALATRRRRRASDEESAGGSRRSGRGSVGRKVALRTRSSLCC